MGQIIRQFPIAGWRHNFLHRQIPFLVASTNQTRNFDTNAFMNVQSVKFHLMKGTDRRRITYKKLFWRQIFYLNHAHMDYDSFSKKHVYRK